MKNLNIHGDKSKEIIISEGRLEDINDFHKIIYISVTESNTDHLINLGVLTHSEEIYVYNNEKYKLDVYTEQECNELFTFPKSLSQDKKEDLIDAFLDNPYENLNDYLDNYNIKYITESDYNTSSYLSMDFIGEKLEEKIMDKSNEKAR